MGTCCLLGIILRPSTAAKKQALGVHMKILVSAGLAIASFCLVAVHATDAAAQATRTWVSGVGDDVNPCSRTAPCKTFAGAISKTATGGVIDVLDPGGFGAITITKSITIRSTGEGGSILAAGTNGVTVNAAGATVSLVNLQIDGAGTGLNGVKVQAAAQVNVIDCKISGFLTAGANGNGISMAAGTSARVLVKDSVIYGNTVGINITPINGAFNRLSMDNTLLDSNLSGNLLAAQASSVVVMNRSTSLNAVISASNGAIIRSYGTNAIAFGVPTEVVPLQ